MWNMRADVVNKSQDDDDGDGVITAPGIGGWVNGRGRPTRLNGGPGPERYLASHPDTQIVEPVDGGIDTIIAWGKRTLPPNVERGILLGDKRRPMGTSAHDRLEVEGRNGYFSAEAGDNLYVIHETARNATIHIEALPGHDQLRGYTDAHRVSLAAKLRAQAANWGWD